MPSADPKRFPLHILSFDAVRSTLDILALSFLIVLCYTSQHSLLAVVFIFWFIMIFFLSLRSCFDASARAFKVGEE